MFDANNKAVDYLYHSLCQSEFERVQTEELAYKIWEQLKNAHAGNAQVQAPLFATYRRKYKNFTHLPGESIDAMFQCFTVIMNNMRANVAVLPYDDHDRAVKLLHSLDRTVWSGKVKAILELEKYETLTVDELFSNLKSSEVDGGCVQRSRTRLTLIVWLSYLIQGIMITCLRDIFLCLALCPCQMRSSTC
jgi:hypothetical protein